MRFELNCVIDSACGPMSPLVLSIPLWRVSNDTVTSKRWLPVTPRSSALSTGSLSGERASLRSLRATSGLGRRGRKVYRITDRGRQEFVALLSDPATLDDSKNFSLRMALAKYLTPNLRVRLLERRRTDLEERLAEVRAGSRNEELDDYARGVMDHAAKGVELDLVWIDDLLSTERSNQQTFANEAK